MSTNTMDSNAALAKLAAMQREIDALNKANADLKAKAAKSGKLTLKVGAKGGVSLYGMGRFPVSLYKEQWEKVLAFAPEIQAFLVAHEGELKSKGDEARVTEGEDPSSAI